MKRVLLLIVNAFIHFTIFAQGVGINNTGATPDVSAMLDVSISGATKKGVLFPRMTMSERNSIVLPATGLMIYQSDAPSGFYYNSGTTVSPAWTMFGVASTDMWKLTGNTGTNPSVNFIGTTDNQPLSIRLNNMASGRLDHTLSSYFIGRLSGSNNTGLFNTAMGQWTLKDNTTGIYNSAFGANALQHNETGETNSAFGAGALFLNSTGTGNSAFGYGSMNVNTEGIYNTAMGQVSLSSNTSGDFNAAFGLGALASNTSGSENIAVGSGAMAFSTTGSLNTVVGSSALYSNTTGSRNVAHGMAALLENETGDANVAIGAYALHNNTFRSNLVAVGDSALYNNGIGANGESGDARWNTAVGSKALFANTQGSYNTAVGHQSQQSNTIGISNTSVGNRSLYHNNIGRYNTGVGGGALFWNTTGEFNCALGHNALGNNDTGNANVAVGLGALIGNSDGYKNTAIGTAADVSPFDIHNATAIGANAYVAQNNSIVLGSIDGVNNATSNSRVGIGVTQPVGSIDVNRGDIESTTSTAIFRGTTYSSNFNYGIEEHTYLRAGNDDAYVILNDIPNGRVGVGFAAPESTLDVVRGDAPGGTAAFRGTTYVTNFNYGTDEDTYINGGKDGSDVFISTNGGNVGIGNTSPGQKLAVTGNICYTGTIAACSDVRYKKDFSPINNALDKVQLMNGIYYYWDSDAFPDRAFGAERQLGFAAQEIEALYPEVVQTDYAGYKSVDYGRLTPVLVEAIKEQQKQIVEQSRMIEQLQQQVAFLMARTEVQTGTKHPAPRTQHPAPSTKYPAPSTDSKKDGCSENLIQKSPQPSK